MSLIKKYFDAANCKSSPVVDDFERVVDYDSDGNELISYRKVDYSKLISSQGISENWSLSSMLKAGVNPDMPIHTGFATRLDGLDSLNDAVSQLDSILDVKSPEPDVKPSEIVE